MTGARVLIVEDEALLAMELETVLRSCGCVVLGPAPSVDRALCLLRGEQPDVALLDLNLRGQPATPVAAELKSRGVPFVVVTGYGRHQLHEPALRDAPLVHKPVRHGELVRAAEAVL